MATPVSVIFDTCVAEDEISFKDPITPTTHPQGVGASMACDHFMLMNVEHLARSLTTLSSAIQSLEARQVGMDERLTELHGSVQGLLEDQSVLAARQDMVAEVVQQKNLNDVSGDHLSRMHGSRPSGTSADVTFRLDEQEHRLTKLGVDVHILASKIDGSRHHLDVLGEGGPQAAKESNSLADRLLQLEKGQKKVLVAAQKALQLAMGFQQPANGTEPGRQSTSNSHENMTAKELMLRLDEQDKTLSELRRSCNHLEDVRVHVKDLQQAVMCNLASHPTTRPLQRPPDLHTSPLTSTGYPSSGPVGNAALNEPECRKRPMLPATQDDVGVDANCVEPSSPTSSLSMSISSASALTTSFPCPSKFGMAPMDCGSNASLALSSLSSSAAWHKDGEASLELFGSSSIFKSGSSAPSGRRHPFGSEFHGS